MLTLPWLQSSKLYMARNQPCHPITPGIGTPPNQALTPHSRCLECTMGADANGGREALNHPPHRRSLASCLPRGMVGPLLSQNHSIFFSLSPEIRSFVRFSAFGISLGLFPSFLPRILICRRPSCSAATKEREGETETSVPFFLLSSDKKPQDRPRPNLFFIHVSCFIDRFVQ